MKALASAHDASVQVIDSSVARFISAPPALPGIGDGLWAGHEAG
jgi:hypothetical protein